MRKVYFLSGLGADRRAFSLLDLSFCEPSFIDWLPPVPHESLPDYAGRLLSQISEPDAVIVGLSFGGMLASEMVHQRPGLQAVVISSNKSAAEFPFYLRVGKYLPLYRWAPNRLYKYGGGLNRLLFGARSAEARRIFKAIQADSDPRFVKWAISAILHWNRKEAPDSVVHIHGGRDYLLPARFVQADHLIPHGTHILPLDFPKEVSELLREIIS